MTREIATMGDRLYRDNVYPYGRFVTATSEFDTSNLGRNFAYFTPEILARCNEDTTQEGFEAIVRDIEREWVAERTGTASQSSGREHG